MMKKLLGAVVIFCLLNLTGCVDVQEASSAQKRTATGPQVATKARVFVYRPGRFLAAGIVHRVYVDGRLLGSNASGYFLVAELDPGHHIVTAGTDQHDLDAKAGHTYYFNQTVWMAMYDPSTASGLEEVSETVGREGVAKCKQAASNF